MWSMPIKNRLDMLATGIKTPVGIKIFGPDLATLDRIGKQIEGILPSVRGTSAVFAERAMGGRYLDVTVDRPAAARYEFRQVTKSRWALSTARMEWTPGRAHRRPGTSYGSVGGAIRESWRTIPSQSRGMWVATPQAGTSRPRRTGYHQGCARVDADQVRRWLSQQCRLCGM